MRLNWDGANVTPVKETRRYKTPHFVASYEVASGSQMGQLADSHNLALGRYALFVM